MRKTESDLVAGLAESLSIIASAASICDYSVPDARGGTVLDRLLSLKGVRTLSMMHLAIHEGLRRRRPGARALRSPTRLWRDA